jgi:SET domain-containing protein
MYSSNSRYLFEINSRKTIDGAPRWNKARYINHSCRPNCEIEIARGRVWIFARRNIKPGEELGYDYGEAYVNEYLSGKCLCAKCAPKAEKAA